MDIKDHTIYCIECGSKNVERLMWVHCNKNEVCDSLGRLDDEDSNWCEDCECNPVLCTIDKLLDYFLSCFSGNMKDGVFVGDFMMMQEGESEEDAINWFVNEGLNREEVVELFNKYRK